jgi:hypothetical protein
MAEIKWSTGESTDINVDGCIRSVLITISTYISY